MVAQARFDLQPLLRALRHFGVEELRAVAALGLGLVHRHVGVAHQLVDVGAVVGVDCDAHAAGDVDLGTLHVVWIPHPRDQPALDDVRHLVAVFHAVQDDDELVAAKAAHRVAGAHGIRKALRHRAQQPVADVMAERIVDVFEAVQVDEQHRYFFSGALRLLQRDAQPLDAKRSIGQLGEHVVLRQKLDALLALLAVGDVDRSADVVRQLTLRLAHRADHQPRRKEFAVVAPQFRLALPGVALLHVAHRLWKNGASAGAGTRNSGRCPTTSWSS
jgi:hypothetical protein